MSATGYAFNHLPEGPERDEILGLLRQIVPWKREHVGRRPGFVHNYLVEVGKGMGDNLSFHALVLELRFRALRNNLHGDDCCLHEVDRTTETVVWCEPGRECYSMPFTTLKNKWTKAKKVISQIHPKP